MANNLKNKPLPMSETLRDLALLRASDIDLAHLASQSGLSDAGSREDGGIDEATSRSYEFVKEARATLRLLNGGELERQGQKTEEARRELTEVLKGLADGP